VYDFWVFLHLVGMAGFLTAHGVSVWVIFEIRDVEGDRDKILDLCDLSKRTIAPMYLSTALLLVGGVAAGIQGHWFRGWWLWVSVLALLATMAMMSSVATPYMKRIRDGCTRWHDGTFTMSDEELQAALGGPITTIISAVGTVGLLVIVYLMVYKPGG
jgi:hypothetical protein